MPKFVQDFKLIGAAVEDTPNRASWPSYDVIIVGGGTSGCALAGRLSEDPNLSVLLLESGPSGQESLLSRIPILHGLLLRTKLDFDVATTWTARGQQRVHHWPRARMLGGCSSMNALIYQYCSPGDFDEWTHNNTPGYEHWAFSQIKSYFQKCENFSGTTIPGVKADQHSTTGPVEVGFNSDPGPMSRPFLEACGAAGIPNDVDFNAPGGTLGANRVSSALTVTYVDKRGQRVSSETAYLSKTVLDRPNLTVAVGATVTRIIFDQSGALPRAVGVEFTKGPGEAKFGAIANKEVVLSAGAVHTPHILMLSGVGPAAQLQAHSIEIVKDLPGVGQNLMDHIVLQTRYRAKPECSYQFLSMKPMTLRAILAGIGALAKWFITGKGPLACNNATTAAFVRSDDHTLFNSSDFPRPVADLTSSPQSPDIEVYSCPLAWKNQNMDPAGPGYLVSLGTIILRPKSRGSVTLLSGSAFEAPAIDPGYLAEQHDVDIAIGALRFAHRLTQQAPFASCLLPSDDVELDHNLHKLNDAQMADLVHERAETLYHPTSSARMGPLEHGGVVDGNLNVHGVKSLRIVDASIFPTILSGHPSAACIMIAEKAADMIKAAYQSEGSSPGVSRSAIP
ncbi:alcohol oxidase [Exidia glandulosa HHB12029]|uniref:Alcohol oxidase n=1 Tax=Exidia glandulosa HHB12029 TaxID=1314781 RepID=A0A165GLC1_EXIGL|nr:alcohol oxidase [Exidia glandulosa HHB12029]